MRHNWFNRLLSICAYGLPNISGFGSSAPERVRFAPPLCLKGSPQLLRYFLPEVASFLKQRWSIRQQASTVQEHLRVSRPRTLIAQEPPDPAVIAINQPSLPHKTLSGYISTISPDQYRQRAEIRKSGLFGNPRVPPTLTDLVRMHRLDRLFRSETTFG